MTTIRILAASFGLTLLCSTASAATLRAVTMLHAPVIRLSDLFGDAGSNADRVLGTAPTPGNQIVVEAAQLAAIARQFGVDWRPASPADRAVLERPGRLLPRDAVFAAVKNVLMTAGASADCVIEMPGFSPPMTPADADPHAVATQLDYDAPSGRFAAILSVTGTGMDPINLRIAGHVDDTVELPVATTRLLAGTVLRPDDVRMARVLVARVRGEVMHGMSDAIGMQLRQPVMAGDPLPVSDVVHPMLVMRGAIVQMQLDTTGLSLLAEGVAQESGATGERIRVLNPVSHAVVAAEVIGPGHVRIMPDSTPIAMLGPGGQIVSR
ncbi:MAG TPA: flagellar basal body P-ring formation chaperone FlgA [Acetobacteraceae bacterium]|jgi:flagella basal body P-ring formation protein FlgA